MLFLDFLLLIMTSLCVVYCWILNKRIQELQNSRIEFARMIKELNVSIVKAEQNVNEMSSLSKITSAEIKSVVEEAKEIAKELIAVYDAAHELSVHLSSKINDTINHQQTNISDKESIYSKSNDKFSDEDLASLEDDSGYVDQLKHFIQKIMVKKSDEQPMNLNQTSYYDTLRKISAKK